MGTADANFPVVVTGIVSCCNSGNKGCEEDERELHFWIDCWLCFEVLVAGSIGELIFLESKKPNETLDQSL
jgi:hypothetical protein